MEMKIIKLLNEYEKEKTKQDVKFWNYYQNGFHYLEDGQSYSELLMISKKYEFIKWLVENDKINKDLISRVLIRAYVSPKTMVSLECEFYDYYESLLMLLVIQDEPIRFLCEILK